MTENTPPPAPAYNFRIIPEIGFAVFVAVVQVLAELLLGLDDSVFEGDLAALGRLAATSLARAVGGAILTVLTRGAFLGPGQVPTRPTTG